MSATSADRRDDVVRLLADAPDGLSDGELARALGDDVRPQTVNALCRRMASAGLVERTGTRPIRNRLAEGADTTAAVAPAGREDPAPADEVEPPQAGREDPAPADEVEPPQAGRGDPPATDEVDPPQAGREDPPLADPPAAEVVRPTDVATHPVRVSPDALQAWSRTVNVQAAVASWLRGRGATIRSATLDGTAPARDLVARLDGAELHVEVTGWPPDGDRTHPTTIAADWFSAAARAAVRRRDDRPHARIVIALPDTRRYRALAAQDVALAGARTEVWFVDATGAVQESS